MSGICQGCPSSPFLFGMLMTVLIADAKADLKQSGVNLRSVTLANELLYADDTLLIDSSHDAVGKYMKAEANAGKHYGL